MRRRTAHNDVPFAVDVVIALALCYAVTVFLTVVECRLTRGELTRAELRLMDQPAHVRHAVVVGIKN